MAKAKRDWRSGHHRGRRPGVWAPGEVLVIDWGVEVGLPIFCAVMAFSRWRFVRFAADEKAPTTLEMLARCFEALGAVPKVVLADRMGCLKGGGVANVVVPAPAYVRLALHYGFRPDFCEGHDPQSKGVVEALVGYAKSDLVVPGGLAVGELARANEAARAWCEEVNARRHSEICAVPAERLGAERPLMGDAALAAAVVRQSGLPQGRPPRRRALWRRALLGARQAGRPGRRGPGARHRGALAALRRGRGCPRPGRPGEASIKDEHYGGARRPLDVSPGPAPRPKKPYAP